ncbi:MAG: ABC transporter ATP-binding protein [Anaerolineae bacterium]|nr:MAG: ABC transporter ATP-binding protein [Anaerolineae bacterium]
MREAVIETHKLTKKYGAVAAVNELDLRVERGEVFGILGPNGSGKTTTILMLLGLTEPTSGKVRVLGFDPAREPLSVKSRVGYIPDRVSFYDELTARENLFYTARLNGLPRREAHKRIAAALERVGLAEYGDQRVGTFSHGMRQRLGVADVLIKNAELIIMDEPTQGMDPEVAESFLNLIRSLKEEGITMLLSSHLLHQVQQVCDRVGLFHKGRMALCGTVPELARQVLGEAYLIHLEVAEYSPQIVQALEALEGVTSVRQEDGHTHRYAVAAPRDLRAEAARAVIQAGGQLLSLDVETQSLNDIYVKYFEEVKHGQAI